MTLPIFVASPCDTVLRCTQQHILMWTPHLVNSPSLKEITIDIVFDAAKFRNVSDPSEDWTAKLTTLNGLEEAFLEALRVSALKRILFRCAVKPFREAVDVQLSISRMFPRLSKQGSATVQYGMEG